MGSEEEIQSGGGSSFGGFAGGEFDYRSSATDIFAKSPIDLSVKGSYTSVFRPISIAGASGPYFFDIPPEGNRCVNPSTLRQWLQLRVQKYDEATSSWVNTEATDSFGMCNNIASSLWGHVECSINNKRLTTTSNPCQAYSSYFQKLLTYSKEVEDTVLACSMWRKHNEKFEFLDLDEVADVEASGKPWKNSTVNYINDAIHTELATLPKILPSGLTLQLTFTRNSSDFLIIQKNSDNNTYRMEIQDFYITAVLENIDSSIHSEWDKMWANNKLATFPITRNVLKTKQFSSGLSYLSFSHVFQGMLPSTIVIGLVNSNGFTGQKNHNPFYFHHHNMRDAVVYVNSRALPVPKLKFDFENKQVKHALRVFYDNIGVSLGNSCPNITEKDYMNGYTLICLNISPDPTLPPHSHVKETGTLNFECNLAAPLKHPATCLVLGCFSDNFFIDNGRNLILSDVSQAT